VCKQEEQPTVRVNLAAVGAHGRHRPVTATSERTLKGRQDEKCLRCGVPCKFDRLFSDLQKNTHRIGTCRKVSFPAWSNPKCRQLCGCVKSEGREVTWQRHSPAQTLRGFDLPLQSPVGYVLPNLEPGRTKQCRVDKTGQSHRNKEDVPVLYRTQPGEVGCTRACPLLALCAHTSPFHAQTIPCVNGRCAHHRNPNKITLVVGVD
jgi:hypothetical protein